jgi:hypothetical protein
MDLLTIGDWTVETRVSYLLPGDFVSLLENVWECFVCLFVTG